MKFTPFKTNFCKTTHTPPLEIDLEVLVSIWWESRAFPTSLIATHHSEMRNRTHVSSASDPRADYPSSQPLVNRASLEDQGTGSRTQSTTLSQSRMEELGLARRQSQPPPPSLSVPVRPSVPVSLSVPVPLRQPKQSLPLDLREHRCEDCLVILVSLILIIMTLIIWAQGVGTPPDHCKSYGR